MVYFLAGVHLAKVTFNKDFYQMVSIKGTSQNGNGSDEGQSLLFSGYESVIFSLFIRVTDHEQAVAVMSKDCAFILGGKRDKAIIAIRAEAPLNLLILKSPLEFQDLSYVLLCNV